MLVTSHWRRCAQAGLVGPGPGEGVILGLLAAVFGAGYSVCCMWPPLKPLPTPEASRAKLPAAAGPPRSPM